MSINIRLKEIIKRRALSVNQTLKLQTIRVALTNSCVSNPFSIIFL